MPPFCENILIDLPMVMRRDVENVKDENDNEVRETDEGTQVAPVPLHKLSVSFSDIHIREYDICLGDNPSCTCGPPISLSWTYKNTIIISIDDYEMRREKRRTIDEMCMPYSLRVAMLKERGYKVKQLTGKGPIAESFAELITKGAKRTERVTTSSRKGLQKLLKAKSIVKRMHCE
mmetsp:Transcript_30199/g.36741  ORF Transcript_30199/g.36741 Transcript_30199/m.36741 type:complete len:176 (+) Transcript_30199:170-697(+)|eukprot:CAMPEP_0194369100 /NCGR_PEP_ID=MMETSP0174-20130528/17367_1 /TAXON_ID=216777 /ORGANISM="Proboscia alata, Strain PI-D3" /LENGTH=175 /DNA_ID=CAMNT_0039145835 /DNA_START=208 /DNA_END=735 /DNA_ORIENTATION=+